MTNNEPVRIIDERWYLSGETLSGGYHSPVINNERLHELEPLFYKYSNARNRTS